MEAKEMNVGIRAIKQKFPNSNYSSIFKDKKSEVIMRETNEKVPGLGRISPFGYDLHSLVQAVALKGKPIAEIAYGYYAKEKDLCNYVIQIFGIKKLDDLEARSLWLFRAENKKDAFFRIAELRKIFKHRLLTIKDHKRMGILYGYSDADINKFLVLRKLENKRKMILE
jgi:hypothetical protein